MAFKEKLLSEHGNLLRDLTEGKLDQDMVTTLTELAGTVASQFTNE